MPANMPKPDDWILLAVILGAPLFGAFFNGVFGKRVGKNGVRIMALAAMVVSFGAAVLTFLKLNEVRHRAEEAASQAFQAAHQGQGLPASLDVPSAKLSWLAWKWFSMATTGSDGRMSIDVKFSVDQLSGVMMLVITGVGLLIHLYSTSYMAKDPGYHRFFAYLNLFVFSMLVLVLADNMPLMFVGWEGVGACSYLLIGFWFDKAANAAAGRKAFIANRIGDVGIIGGMLCLAHATGALDWDGINAGLLGPAGTGGVLERFPNAAATPGAFSVSLATVACLAIFLGCTGKSAQIPLYVWLPDAMAGPTPVSALIHAATMVTSGIYLICRLNFLFVYSPFAMMIIAIVGAATALFAATIALVQNDIKKILAYSTVSQLGFMFLGVGVGAFSYGFFHVFTHAFFKACLFLGAGSVIHAMHKRIHDDVRSQDMRNMGGLRRFMPWTYLSMAAATLAIAGLPLTSGFFSKDGILFHAWSNKIVHPIQASAQHNIDSILAKGGALGSTDTIPFERQLGHFQAPEWIGKMLYVVGVLAATMTAFYMFRLLFRTFWGEFRGWKVDPKVALATNPLENEETLLDDDELPAHGHAAHVHDAHAAKVAHDDAHDVDAHHDAASLGDAHDDGTHGAHDEHHEDLVTPAAPPAEAPWTMAIPVAILGAMALVAGLLYAEPLHIAPLGEWLWPVFRSVMQHTDVAGPDAGSVFLREGTEKLELPLMLGGVLAFAVGLGVAWLFYVKEDGQRPAQLAKDWPRVYRAAYNKWYVDEAYDATIIGGTDALADGAALMDVWIIDGVIAKLSSNLASGLGAALRAVQNGVVQVYGSILAVGALGLVLFLGRPHADVTVHHQADVYTLEAGPGLGYSYKWTIDGKSDPAFSDLPADTTRSLTLKDGETKSVTLEIQNAFGRTATRVVQVGTPPAVTASSSASAAGSGSQAPPSGAP